MDGLYPTWFVARRGEGWPSRVSAATPPPQPAGEQRAFLLDMPTSQGLLGMVAAARLQWWARPGCCHRETRQPL